MRSQNLRLGLFGFVAITSGITGCATGARDPVTADPDEVEISAADGAAAVGVPDVHCDGAPDAGAPGRFRHLGSWLTAVLGDPRHRGLDLVASADAGTQTVEGWISYTVIDKALEDEDVDVLACRAGSWQRIGGARTDDEGHFALALAGADRLPIGMRDLFVSVVGDRTGVRFLADVAPVGAPMLVSDVDGTLTSSEDAFFETILLGLEPGAQAGAAAAYASVVARGYQLVYLTARGNEFTTDTRAWLADKGFPRGPLRLSPSFVTSPGSGTVDFKATAMVGLTAAGFALAAGIGNRATDVAAYAQARIAADRIFIELPEFAGEVQPLIDAGDAVGFTSYAELAADLRADLP
jgi:hypothetical protein